MGARIGLLRSFILSGGPHLPGVEIADTDHRVEILEGPRFSGAEVVVQARCGCTENDVLVVVLRNGTPNIPDERASLCCWTAEDLRGP